MRYVRHDGRLVKHAHANLLDRYLADVGVPRYRHIVPEPGYLARLALQIAPPQRLQQSVAQPDAGNDLDGSALLVGQVGAQECFRWSGQGSRIAAGLRVEWVFRKCSWRN